MLLRREPADEADDRLAVRRPASPQLLVACRRCEAGDVDARAPTCALAECDGRQGFPSRPSTAPACGRPACAGAGSTPTPRAPRRRCRSSPRNPRRRSGIPRRSARRGSARRAGRRSRAGPATPDARRRGRIRAARSTIRGRGTPSGSEVIFGNIRDGTRCTRTPSWTRSAGVHPRGVSGAMTSDFVTGAAEMLDHPKHRVGDAVDIREEGLCDDRNAHTKSVPSTAVVKVASRAYDTQRSRANDRAVGEPGFEYRAHREGRLTCGFPGPWC